MSLDIQELWKIHREGVRVIESGKYSDQEKEQRLADLYRRLVDIHGALPSKPKKPGRKGTRIRDAFDVITTEAQSLDDLLERFGVSLATIRQHKRFDPFPERGKIHTRTIAGRRMVWRET
jgi:hypothetical protein